MSVLKNTQLGSNSPALEKPAECWPRIQNPMANISEAIVWGKQCREGGLGLIGWLQSILFRPLYPYSMTAISSDNVQDMLGLEFVQEESTLSTLSFLQSTVLLSD